MKFSFYFQKMNDAAKFKFVELESHISGICVCFVNGVSNDDNFCEIFQAAKLFWDNFLFDSDVWDWATPKYV